MRVPGEAVVASHAQPAASFEHPPGAGRAAFERLLMAVDHRCGMPNSGPRSMLICSKYNAGTTGTSREDHVQGFVVDERAVFERVVAGPQARS